MLGQFSDQQFDQMRQQLIVPLAVSDILTHDIHVEPDMQYGLHMALSEVDPDSALLAIALCAHDLATKCAKRAPIAGALQTEAGNIMQEYGPIWLRNNLNAPISPSTYEEILDTVPEDLEALADLMDALQADLNDENDPCVILAKLLSIQARAHMEIADFVLAEIAYEKQSMDKKDAPSFGYQSVEAERAQPTEQFAGDNIIVFPGSAT